MSTQIFYPHFLQLSTVLNVVRFDSVDMDPNYNMIQRMGGADPYPCFVGASSADPEISFTTPSVWDVLSACTDFNVLADLSAADATMFYRKGKPLSFRQPLTSALHVSMVLQQSAILAFNSLSAREDQDATISATLRTARKNAATDPWLNQGTVANLPASLCEDLFALGPIVYDGRLIGSIYQVEWNNNLRPYSRKTSLSPRDPDWQSFHDMTPQITCTTNDLEEVTHSAPANDTYGGRVMNQLRIYLRKRTQTGFYVADNLAQHIELVAYGGWKGGGRITGQEPADANIEFHLSAAVVGGVVQGTDRLFDRQLSKIPSGLIAPAMASFPNQAHVTGDVAFFTPNLDGGGIPTSFSIFSGALPAGVSLNTTSGLLSGTITAGAGTYNATIRGTNGFGNDDQAIQYDIT